MKMKYEKPIAAVDLYELSQSIAGCHININNTNSGCFLEADDSAMPPEIKSFAAIGWFISGSCDIGTVAGTTYDGSLDGICFHTQANGALKS